MTTTVNEKPTCSWSNGHLLALLAMLVGAACVFHLACAAKGYSFYRDQHLGTAIEYSRGHIDLLKPIIVGFNATETPTPQEIPLWQALTAIALKHLGPWFGWANLVSLLCFYTALLPLFCIARDFLGARCAWWTLVLFAAEPMVFVYAGTAGTDGFSLAVTIWFLFCALNLLRKPGAVWWVATVVMGVAAALEKLPFFLVAGLTCFFCAVRDYRQSLRPWLFLGTAAFLITAVFFAWTKYTDHCIAIAEFPFVDLRLSAPDMKFWYFGDWHYRLSPGNWIKGGWRLLNDGFGSFALAGPFLYALLFLRQNVLPRAALLASILTTLVFSHLFLQHTHYYLIYAPAIAMLGAQAAVAAENRFPFANGCQSRLALAIVAVVLFASVIQGLIGMKVVLAADRYPHEMARTIQQYCSPSDKLLIQGGGWGGDLLILSDRQGLSIWGTKLLEDPGTLRRLKQLGYNKLVMVSGSPLITALEKVNPGQTETTRQGYREFLTDVARDWPTLVENDDILIKTIP
jgi:Dolichyl-phosphate-mannose-protein mannosyltransferase